METQTDPNPREILQGADEYVNLSLVDADGDVWDFSSGYSATALVAEVGGTESIGTISNSPFTNITLSDGTGDDGENIRVKLDSAFTAGLKTTSRGRDGRVPLYMDVFVAATVGGDVVARARVNLMMIQSNLAEP